MGGIKNNAYGVRGDLFLLMFGDSLGETEGFPMTKINYFPQKHNSFFFFTLKAFAMDNSQFIIHNS